MAASEGKPLMQHDEDLVDVDTACGCGCFRAFRFNHWRRVPNGDGGGGGSASGWAAEKMKKVKEVSELIAGPKWKTLIRKIGNYNRKQNNKNRYQFQYDEHSYALNFNSGANSEDDDDAHMPPSFSARFTAPRQQPQSSINSASSL